MTRLQALLMTLCLALSLAPGCRSEPPVGPPLGSLPHPNAQGPNAQGPNAQGPNAQGPGTAAGRPPPPLGPIVMDHPPGRLPGQGGVLPGQGGVLPGQGGMLPDNGPLESSTISKAAAILNALVQTIIIVGAMLLGLFVPSRWRARQAPPRGPGRNLPPR